MVVLLLFILLVSIQNAVTFAVFLLSKLQMLSSMESQLTVQMPFSLMVLLLLIRNPVTSLRGCDVQGRWWWFHGGGFTRV